jgi:REP element-mobilizing transposase RayT
MMEREQWHWQEPGKAWKGAGIYHVTLTVPSREPLFGTLCCPDNDPAQAYVERTELGKQIVHTIFHIQDIHPEVRVMQFCIMPDHVHVVLYVTQTMTTGIKTVVRGWWQGVKKLHALSVAPNIIRDNQHSLFSEIPFIRPMSRRGQLDAIMQYVKLNPQRLATKRLKPGLFRVQEDIEIAGRKYSSVGNLKLLLAARYRPVHVRRTMVDEAEHGDDKRLRDYMNSCVLAARQGAVMVSPFISEKEKEVLIVLLAEEHPIIILADNGFRDYYKPSDGIFDSVAAGRVLILSPWEYDPKKRHISRADCVALNQMAEEIANSL